MGPRKCCETFFQSGKEEKGMADGDKNYFTRSGTFGLDKDGKLVNPSNGMKVQGWMASRNEQGEMVVNASGSTEDIIIPVFSKAEN